MGDDTHPVTAARAHALPLERRIAARPATARTDPGEGAHGPSRAPRDRSGVRSGASATHFGPSSFSTDLFGIRPLPGRSRAVPPAGDTVERVRPPGVARGSLRRGMEGEEASPALPPARRDAAVDHRLPEAAASAASEYGRPRTDSPERTGAGRGSLEGRPRSSGARSGAVRSGERERWRAGGATPVGSTPPWSASPRRVGGKRARARHQAAWGILKRRNDEGRAAEHGGPRASAGSR